jgi:glycerol uptake facilitator-like aquaporin
MDPTDHGGKCLLASLVSQVKKGKTGKPVNPAKQVGKCLLASMVSQVKKAKTRKQASQVLLAMLGSLWKGI